MPVASPRGHLPIHVAAESGNVVTWLHYGLLRPSQAEGIEIRDLRVSNSMGNLPIKPAYPDYGSFGGFGLNVQGCSQVSGSMRCLQAELKPGVRLWCNAMLMGLAARLTSSHNGVQKLSSLITECLSISIFTKLCAGQVSCVEYGGALLSPRNLLGI